MTEDREKVICKSRDLGVGIVDSYSQKWVNKVMYVWYKDNSHRRKFEWYSDECEFEELDDLIMGVENNVFINICMVYITFFDVCLPFVTIICVLFVVWIYLFLHIFIIYEQISKLFDIWIIHLMVVMWMEGILKKLPGNILKSKNIY